MICESRESGVKVRGVRLIARGSLVVSGRPKMHGSQHGYSNERDGNGGYPRSGLPTLFWRRSFPGRAHSAIMQQFNVKALPFTALVAKEISKPQK